MKEVFILDGLDVENSVEAVVRNYPSFLSDLLEEKSVFTNYFLATDLSTVPSSCLM